MLILNLKDKPEHLLPLAQWHHAEWSYLNPLRSFDQRIKDMQEDLQGKAIPTTFVAEDAGELLG